MFTMSVLPFVESRLAVKPNILRRVLDKAYHGIKRVMSSRRRERLAPESVSGAVSG